jgi:hypothetical protein
VCVCERVCVCRYVQVCVYVWVGVGADHHGHVDQEHMRGLCASGLGSSCGTLADALI